MKKIVIAALMLLPMTGFAAGFDCAKAGTRIEHMICDNPELDQLDEEMTQMYRALSKGPDAAQIQKEQREWNKSRNKAQTPEELAQMYDDRMSELAEGKSVPVADKKSEPVQVASPDSEVEMTKVAQTFGMLDFCKRIGTLNGYDAEIKDAKAQMMSELKTKIGTEYDKKHMDKVYGEVMKLASMVDISDAYQTCKITIKPILVGQHSANNSQF